MKDSTTSRIIDGNRTIELAGSIALVGLTSNSIPAAFCSTKDTPSPHGWYDVVHLAV
jgi:hypothetical protein